jgi:hypothetical protein
MLDNLPLNNLNQVMEHYNMDNHHHSIVNQFQPTELHQLPHSTANRYNIKLDTHKLKSFHKVKQLLPAMIGRLVAKIQETAAAASQSNAE